MKKGLIAFLSVFMIAVLAACGSTEGDEIELSETSVEIDQYETMQIEATVLPDEEDVDQTVTWESSDEDVVQVTQDGEIGGMAGGEATVTVTSDVYEDVSAELDVTVKPEVDYVSVEETDVAMTLNEDRSSVTKEIDWEVEPVGDYDYEFSADDVTFESTNEDVATVDEDGVITAHTAGAGGVKVSAGDESVFFNLSVSDYMAEHTVADVRDADTGTEVETYGVVTSKTNHATFTIEDAGGAISVYDGGEEYIGDVEVGDEIYITGERDEFNGLVQIGNVSDVQVGHEDIESEFVDLDDDDAPEPHRVQATYGGISLFDPVDLTTRDLEDADALLEYQNHRVTMEQMVITDYTYDPGGYGNYELTLESLVNGSEISLRYDSRVDNSDAEDQMDNFDEGDEVALVGITLGWYGEPQVLYSEESQIMDREDFDDNQVKAAMDEDLDVSGEYDEDITLADEFDQDDYELDVDWESSDTDYVADDGTVTRPDALNEEVEVDLTATVTDPDDSDFEHEVVSTVTITPYTPEEAALEAVADEMPETVAYGDDLSDAMYPDGGFDFTQYIDEESELFYEDGEWDLNVEWSSECAFLDPDDGTLTDVGHYDRTAEVTVTLTNDAAVNRFEAEHTFTVTLEGDEFADDADLESYLTNDLTKEELGLPDGDIYEDVELPSTLEIGQYELDVSWASDDTDVLTTDGEVSRSAAGDGDDTVTMTATFEDGSDVNQDVTMDFNVAELMSDSEIDTAIEDEFGTEPTLTASEDIDLAEEYEYEEFIDNLAVEAGRDLNVEWSVTDDQDYLTADGEVTRPEYDEDDEVVTLTMTVTDDDDYENAVDVEVTISAITVSPQDQALYDDIADTIDEDHEVEGLEFDDVYPEEERFSLPETATFDGFEVDVAWEEEDNDYFSYNSYFGNITVNEVPSIYEDDVTVELTATYTAGDFEHTKTFDVLIEAKRVEDVVEMDDLYELEENHFDWTLDAEDEFALIDWYSLDNHEFDVDWDAEMIVDEDAEDPEDRDIDDFVDFDEGIITKPAMGEEPFDFTLTATINGVDFEEDITVDPVSSQDQLNNRYDNYLGDWLPEETLEDINLPSELELLGNSADLDWTVVTGSAYITDSGEVTLPEDENVTVTLGVTATGDADFYAEYDVTVLKMISEDELEVALDDEDWDFPTELTENLTLPSEVYYRGYDLDVSWSSDNTSYLADDGTVTRPAAGESDENVTLTATYTDDDDFSYSVDFDMVVLAEKPLPSDLFISEYMDGSGNSKAIEIYNGTGSDVDLTDYTVEHYQDSDPNTVWQSYDLPGTLADGEVYVITTDQAADDLAAEADVELSYPSVAHFAGDDTITLSNDGTIIDIFGIVGETDWETDETSEHTLVRKSSVTEPTTTWDLNEWDVYPEDTFDYIGSHTME